MAIQPAIARQNGRGSSHCNSDFFSSVTKSLLCWHRDPPLKRLSSRIGPLAVIPCNHPASIHGASKRPNLKRCGCKWSIVRRAGLPCTRMTLAPRALPFSSSQGPVRKKNCGAEDLSSRWLASSHRLSVRAPRCHREGIRLSSSPNLISVPPRLRAVWSRSVWATMNWMTAFLWQLQMRKCNLPLSASCSARLKVDDELIRMMTKAVKELGLEWSPSRSRLDCFLPGRHQALRQRSSPSTTKCTTSSRNLDACPIRLVSAPLLQPLSLPLTALKRKDTRTWMSPWPQISARQRLSDGRRGRHIHPNHAELHLHSLDVPTQRLDMLLQRCTRWLCFRSFKLRCSPTRMPVWILPHSGTWEVQRTWLCAPPKPQPKRLYALCPASSCWSATSGSRWWRWKRRIKFLSSTLRSRQVACLDQLWRASLNVSRRLRSCLKRCDTSPPNTPALLLLPVAPNLRRLSRQPKPAPTTPEPRFPEERRDRGCSRSARRYNFLKRQGPRPKIALDPVPKKSSWSARQKEEGPESRYRRTTSQTASHVSLATSRNAGWRETFVFPHFHGVHEWASLPLYAFPQSLC